MTADKRKYLKVAEGRAVRRPEDGQPWPEAGDYAEDILFIRRRLADGDLVQVEAPKPVKPAAAEDKK